MDVKFIGTGLYKIWEINTLRTLTIKRMILFILTKQINVVISHCDTNFVDIL